MKKSPIGKVKEFEVGQAFEFEGAKCVIESFPTRSSVVLRNVVTGVVLWSRIKTSISFFRENSRRVEG